MPTIYLDPVSDGTVTGWTGTAGSVASNIDDYDNGGLDNGAHDSDTTRALGPNKTNSSMFVLLQATPSDFNPNGITAVRIKWTPRRVTGGASGGTDTIDGFVSIYKADEATAMTDEASRINIDNGYAGNEWTETMTPTGTFTKADWDGARLRIRQVWNIVDGADTTSQITVTAARLEIDYDLAPSGQILRPDADLDAAGWVTAPLFSKINDTSDASFVTDGLV